MGGTDMVGSKFYRYADFLLLEQVDVLGAKNPLTALVVNLTGVDPDDAFSVVPYEKGSAFLWYLEDTVGGPGGTTVLACMKHLF